MNGSAALRLYGALVALLCGLFVRVPLLPPPTRR
jgi:hypothetical protein